MSVKDEMLAVLFSCVGDIMLRRKLLDLPQPVAVPVSLSLIHI